MTKSDPIDSRTGKSNAFVPGLLLLAVTFCLYLPATQHKFVNYDDEQYIYENPWVSQGFSVAGIKWALSATGMGRPSTVTSSK